MPFKFIGLTGFSVKKYYMPAWSIIKMTRDRTSSSPLVSMLPLLGKTLQSTNRLFHFSYQSVATAFGGEKPDQKPDRQDDKRPIPDKKRYLTTGYQGFDPTSIRLINAVKKTNDNEEWTIKKLYPTLVWFNHKWVPARDRQNNSMR